MIGEEVRRQREGLGLTGAQLAARAGMAPSAVSQIETGRRTPSSASVVKLAEALGVEVGDLYPKKAQAPLPLEELEEQRGGNANRWKAAYETACNAHQALGEALVEQWRKALDEWEEKLPSGENELGSADRLEAFIDWVVQAGETKVAYEVVAEVGYPGRPELQDTVKQMEKVLSAAFAKARRILEKVKTHVEFREIVKNFERLEGVELDVR